MDGYIPKPLRMDDMHTEIAALGIAATEIGEDAPLPARVGIADLTAARARLGDDDALYKEVVELFLREAGDQLSALRASVTNSDLDEAQRIAHALRGALGNFYAHEAIAATETFEAAAAAGEHATAGEALVELEAALDRLCPRLVADVEGTRCES
jgi:HPt (histidine-containing phosphotransfer) domain-containing protein